MVAFSVLSQYPIKFATLDHMLSQYPIKFATLDHMLSQYPIKFATLDHMLSQYPIKFATFDHMLSQYPIKFATFDHMLSQYPIKFATFDHMLSQYPIKFATFDHMLSQYPIKFATLDHMLSQYPVLEDASFLREGFSKCFCIGYSGPRQSRVAGCLSSASANMLVVRNKLAQEIKLGRIAGPFKVMPFRNLQCSPIGLVPKKGPNSFRLIRHLSFPAGGSINDFISKDKCRVHYASSDSAVQLVM